MGNLRRSGLICVLLFLGISVLWGTWISYTQNAWLDFRAVYSGTRCLMHGHNPYDVGDMEREYASEGGRRPTAPPWATRSIVLYVNMPTAFVFLAPFAALPYNAACALWMLLTGGAFTAAVLLMWSTGARSAPDAATVLACFLAANCESVFAGGNTAGMVVAFCVIAAWLLLNDRLAGMGVLLLGFCLAVKPHDAGFVWLYFLLAGGVHRKRALQSLLITAAIGAASVVWVWHVAPHWMQDWSANMAAISGHGGINEPGLNSITGRFSSPIVDLQALISVFRDVPGFYNALTYIVCGGLLLAWAIGTARARFSRQNAWIAMAAVTALTLLITYHRVWDAKLIMLAIPACCQLWAEGGWTGKFAFALAAAAVLFTGDVSLAFFDSIYNLSHMSDTGISGLLLTVVFLRPASIALLAMGVFYLWAYLRRVRRVEPALAGTPEMQPASKVSPR